MRVLLDIDDRGGEHFAVVTAPGLPGPSERPVRWTAARRLLVAKDEQITDADADALAAKADAGTASAEDLERYGTLLFEAAFGAETWRRLTDAASRERGLELAIRGPAAVQALRWEALRDGTAHIAAKGSGGGRVPVGIVRLIPQSNPLIPNESSLLSPATRLPRVLYAVGSRLTDPGVRPGAEFMGILRHTERKGGTVQPRVLQQATARSLAWQLEHFKPDVLHVIGHGRRFEVEGCVKLRLRPEPEAAPGEEFLTAGQLLGVFRAAGHVPAMVVLSVCQAGGGSVNALPFAADLVAGGVAVVVAMAGDVSDTACRVFARALARAVGDGVPIAEAVLRGRRATFHERPGPDSADWLLPVVFLAGHMPAGTRLADTAAIRAARRRCQDLDLDWEPVFCGRAEFVAAMDRLLDGDDPLNVLAAYTPDARESYGGMRLLRELAARAVRAGRLPVLLGPFDDDPPVTLERLAGEVGDKLDDMRGLLGLPVRPALPDLLADAAGQGPKALARAIREALAGLAGDLPGGDPAREGPVPRVVLLCHRVDLWDDVAYHLFAPGKGMLGPRGLGVGAEPVPVVLTGADDGDLKKARERCNGASWAKFLPLGRFRDDDEDPEDILAYLWWLLNPPDRTPVYAPKRGADHQDWQGLLRWAMRDKAIYDEAELFGWARHASAFFTSDTDDDILAGYEQAAP